MANSDKKEMLLVASKTKDALKGSGFNVSSDSLDALNNYVYWLVDQQTEGKIGYLSALSKEKIDGISLLVWDIGAESMQFSTVDNDYNVIVYHDKLGSSDFKNMVIEGVKGKNHKKIRTPNPIGKRGSYLAKKLAKVYGQINIPVFIKKRASTMTVVGIGAVHSLSIKGLIGTKKDTYSVKQLKKAIKKYQKFSDKKIGGDYASSDVTNLILSLGFMEALGIKEVKTIKLNMSHGILVSSKYWKF